MSKITLQDNYLTCIEKLVEGNPGAVKAIRSVSEVYEQIDPDSAFGVLSPLLALDSHEIYGSSIYVLYNDKCKNDPRKFILLLRAVQLGLFSERKLQEMAADQMYEINLTEEEWEKIDKEVCETLPDFQKNNS